MPVKYKPGQYLAYPCQCCGQKMQLEDDFSRRDKVTLKCNDCKEQTKLFSWEVKSIINSRAMFN